VVAVNDLDIYAGVGHTAGYLSQLAGLVLPQPLDKNLADAEDFDTNGFESLSGCVAVFEKKMHIALAVNNPAASALDTDASSAKSLAHAGHFAWFVF
jgi:hypothetical protein